MKESQFIKQCEKKWKNFETDLKLERKAPEKTSKLFIQITDELSYARTHYPNRMIRKYLDGVSQILLSRIYKNQRFQFSSFMAFWSTKLPLEVYKARRAFTVSTLVFLTAFGIGVLSSVYNPEFAQVILGDTYVDMTLENIESGDPMAVYKDFNATEGFTMITLNNINVAFRTFIFGLLAAVGSLFILVYNGIMVGAFQFFFIERGLFWESFLTIWQHGTIEISAIVIAGAAGLTLGRGLIFTGNNTRLQSFKLSGQRGLTIFLGTVPLFIIAGFIEGFITRNTEAHPALRISVILFSALFIFYYFWWYPRKVGAHEEMIEEEVIPEDAQGLEFSENTIYTLMETTSLSFRFILRKPYLIISALALALGASYFLTSTPLVEKDYLSDVEEIIYQFIAWMDFSEVMVPPVLLSIGVLLFSLLTHAHLEKKSVFRVFNWQKALHASLIFLPLINPLFWLVILFTYPLTGLMATRSNSDVTSLKLKASYSKSLGLFSLIVGLSILCYIFLALFNVYVINGVLLVLTNDVELRDFISYCIYNMAGYSVFTLSLLFSFPAFYYLRFTVNEIEDAHHLKNRIQLFSEKYNLVKEA